jgi:putative ABC transport system ATP-binding protein
MSAALELRDVTKTYGAAPNELCALRAANLVVEPGELVAIMGPSGSGKSTLLTIAGGLESATSGSVDVAGQDITSMTRDERATFRRRSIGYVFQELNLLAALTAAENVALPLEFDGMSARQARTLALAALERVGVGDKARCFPDNLSGGERQRVAIARAVIQSPANTAQRLLLADEPTGALDSVNGEAIMLILTAACRDGAAGVIVTHDAHLAAWADRVIFLRDGVVVDSTTPDAGPESITIGTR